MNSPWPGHFLFSKFQWPGRDLADMIWPCLGFDLLGTWPHAYDLPISKEYYCLGAKIFPPSLDHVWVWLVHSQLRWKTHSFANFILSESYSVKFIQNWNSNKYASSSCFFILLFFVCVFFFIILKIVLVRQRQKRFSYKVWMFFSFILSIFHDGICTQKMDQRTTPSGLMGGIMGGQKVVG